MLTHILCFFSFSSIAALNSAQWQADFYFVDSVVPIGRRLSTDSSYQCSLFAITSTNCKGFKVERGFCQCVDTSKLVITNPDHDRAVKVWIEVDELPNLPKHLVGVSEAMDIYDASFETNFTINYNKWRDGGAAPLKPYVYLKNERTFVFITSSGGDVFHWKLGSSAATKIDMGGQKLATGFFTSIQDIIFYYYKVTEKITQTYALYGGKTYKTLSLLDQGFGYGCTSFSPASKDEVYLIGGKHGGTLHNGIYKYVMSNSSFAQMASIPGVIGLWEFSCVGFESGDGDPAIFITGGRHGPDPNNLQVNPDSWIYFVESNEVVKLDSAMNPNELKAPTLWFVKPFVYMAGGKSYGKNVVWARKILPTHGQNWQQVKDDIGFELGSYGLVVPIN